MNAATETAPAPKLLKARMRHTRLLIMLFVPWVLFTDTMHSEADILHEVLEWAGHFLVIAGVLGRVFCSVYIAGRKNDVLTCDGPYSIVRNPLYVFSFLAVVGIGLQSATFSLAALLVVIWFVYYPKVIAREEAFLLNKFGDPYRNYLATVPRWWPKFSLWKSPEEITVRPSLVLKTMLDASLFFLAFPMFELLDYLHQSGHLPVLLHLP